MRQEVEMKVREIMKTKMDISIPVDEIDNDVDLLTYGANSFTYVTLVAGIEDEYGFEFDDEYLDFRTLKTLGGIIDYVVSKLS